MVKSLGVMFTVAACLVLIQCGVESSPIPDTNTTAVGVSGEGVCSNKALLESLRVIVSESEPGIRRLGDIPAYAAASCQQIASLRPEASSGHYWIQEESGPTRVYCVMEGVSCGEGVWMEVANVNMTQTSSRCPAGLEKVTSPKSLCRKTVNVGCSSASFSTHGVPFSKVCGRVIGYQYFDTDAFSPYYHHQGRTIDDMYVEGVSFTHSRVPRQHIWSLASNIAVCPRANSKSHVAFTGLIPEFIGNNFYCETGSRTSYSNRYYLEDPLWDGQGCGRYSSCCEGEGKPWFFKELSQSVTSDIEARVCADDVRNNEDVLIEILSLYVQ
jgi:hypothetical protein